MTTRVDLPAAPTLRDDLLPSLSESWTRTLVSDLEITAKARTTEWLAGYDRVYAGSGSLVIADTHEKLLSWRTWPATSGELARAYLRHLWDEGTPQPLMARASALGFQAQAPLWCEPVDHRTLAYVDVTSCYWQLLSPYAPDAMPLGRSTNEGHLSWWRPEEVAADRQLRHAIAGAMWSSQIEWCHRGEWVRASAVSRWSNPYVKARVMHTLHAVALDVQSRFTLFAWLTDAAIVDAHQAKDVIAHLAESWHLSSRIVAEGSGSVWNVTAHRVGPKATLNIEHGRIPEQLAPFSNLQAPEEGISWLRSERLEHTTAPALQLVPTRLREAVLIRPVDHTWTEVERDLAVSHYPPGHVVLRRHYGCRCDPAGDGVLLTCPLHTVAFWPPGTAEEVRVTVRHTRTPEPIEPEPEWDWLYEPF